jgi:hypothetical protein
MRLRVHIDKQNSFACAGKSTCQIYRHRSFATTTFLINNRYGSHNFSPAPYSEFRDSSPTGHPKRPLLLLKNVLTILKTTQCLSNYSAKKYRKLYIFMGRANKNGNTCINTYT